MLESKKVDLTVYPTFIYPTPEKNHTRSLPYKVFSLTSNNI